MTETHEGVHSTAASSGDARWRYVRSSICPARPVLTVHRHWPQVAAETVEYDESSLGHAVTVNYILDAKDFIGKREFKLSYE